MTMRRSALAICFVLIAICRLHAAPPPADPFKVFFNGHKLRKAILQEIHLILKADIIPRHPENHLFQKFENSFNLLDKAQTLLFRSPDSVAEAMEMISGYELWGFTDFPIRESVRQLRKRLLKEISPRFSGLDIERKIREYEIEIQTRELGMFLMKGTFDVVNDGLRKAEKELGTDLGGFVEARELLEKSTITTRIRKTRFGHRFQVPVPIKERFSLVKQAFDLVMSTLGYLQEHKEVISDPEIQKAIDVFRKFRKALIEKKISRAIMYLDPLSHKKYQSLFDAVGADTLAIQARDEMKGIYPLDYDKSIERIEFLIIRKSGDQRRASFLYMRKNKNKWLIEQL